METAIVMPVFNEEENIVDTIKNVGNFVGIEDIIVVDDGSRDQTYNFAMTVNCTVLKHIINLGKGAALKTGCDFAVRNGAKKIICIDGDGQHNPKHIPVIKEELDKVDIVYTYRKVDTHKMPFILRVGNTLINKIGFLFFNIKLKDPLSGYRGFTAEAYNKIRWATSGYAVENEIIFNMYINKLTFTEIPIETIYKDRYKGTDVLDGAKIFMNILWWRLTKRKK